MESRETMQGGAKSQEAREEIKIENLPDGKFKVSFVTYPEPSIDGSQKKPYEAQITADKVAEIVRTSSKTETRLTIVQKDFR